MYHFRITISYILWFWICCFGYYPCHCSGLWWIYCKSSICDLHVCWRLCYCQL